MSDRELKVNVHDWVVLVKLDDSEISRGVLVTAVGEQNAKDLAEEYVHKFYKERWHKKVTIEILSAGVLTFAEKHIPMGSYTPFKV